MAYKEFDCEFSTQLSVQEIVHLLDRAFRKVGVEHRESIPGYPTGTALRVSGRTAPFSPFVFLIDIYVSDNGSNRTISLIALGSDASTFLRTSLTREQGVYAKMRSSKRIQKEILRILRNA